MNFEGKKNNNGQEVIDFLVRRGFDATGAVVNGIPTILYRPKGTPTWQPLELGDKVPEKP